MTPIPASAAWSDAPASTSPPDDEPEEPDDEPEEEPLPEEPAAEPEEDPEEPPEDDAAPDDPEEAPDAAPEEPNDPESLKEPSVGMAEVVPHAALIAPIKAAAARAASQKGPTQGVFQSSTSTQLP